MRTEMTPASRTVVGRLATILLTLRGGGSHSLTELTQLTGLPMSTVHRLAGELASWQLLRRDVDGRYRVGVGPNVQWLADGAGVPGLDDRAPLALADLCEVTGRRARLGVLRGSEVAYVEKRPGAGPPTAWSDAATLPAHARRARRPFPTQRSMSQISISGQDSWSTGWPIGRSHRVAARGGVPCAVPSHSDHGPARTAG